MQFYLRLNLHWIVKIYNKYQQNLFGRIYFFFFAKLKFCAACRANSSACPFAYQAFIFSTDHKLNQFSNIASIQITNKSLPSRWIQINSTLIYVSRSKMFSSGSRWTASWPWRTKLTCAYWMKQTFRGSPVINKPFMYIFIHAFVQMVWVRSDLYRVVSTIKLFLIDLRTSLQF